MGSRSKWEGYRLASYSGSNYAGEEERAWYALHARALAQSHVANAWMTLFDEQ